MNKELAVIVEPLREQIEQRGHKIMFVLDVEKFAARGDEKMSQQLTVVLGGGKPTFVLTLPKDLAPLVVAHGLMRAHGLPAEGLPCPLVFHAYFGRRDGEGVAPVFEDPVPLCAFSSSAMVLIAPSDDVFYVAVSAMIYQSLYRELIPVLERSLDLTSERVGALQRELVQLMGPGTDPAEVVQGAISFCARKCAEQMQDLESCDSDSDLALVFLAVDAETLKDEGHEVQASAAWELPDFALRRLFGKLMAEYQRVLFQMGGEDQIPLLSPGGSC